MATYIASTAFTSTQTTHAYELQEIEKRAKRIMSDAVAFGIDRVRADLNSYAIMLSSDEEKNAFRNALVADREELIEKHGAAYMIHQRVSFRQVKANAGIERKKIRSEIAKLREEIAKLEAREKALDEKLAAENATWATPAKQAEVEQAEKQKATTAASADIASTVVLLFDDVLAARYD